MLYPIVACFAYRLYNFILVTAPHGFSRGRAEYSLNGLGYIKLQLLDMQDLNEGVKLLQSSKNIMLTGSPRISYDELASLVCLYLLFQEQGKSVSVVFAEKPIGLREELLNRYNVPVETKISEPSYTISIPFENGEIEGIRYDKEGGNLNLYITPGKAQFDFDKVKYAVQGGNAETILIVGCKRIDWLGGLQRDNKDLFESAKKVNLTTQKGAQTFGDINLIDQNKQTLSEVVYDLISLLGGTQNEKIINCLLEGLVAGVNFVQEGEVSEPTMNIIANLSKAGANLKEAVNQVYFSSKEAKELAEEVKKELKGEIQAPEAVAQKDETPIKKAVKGVKEVVKSVKEAVQSEMSELKPESETSEEDESGIPAKGFVEPPAVNEAAVVPFGAPVKKSEEK